MANSQSPLNSVAVPAGYGVKSKTGKRNALLTHEAVDATYSLSQHAHFTIQPSLATNIT